MTPTEMTLIKRLAKYYVVSELQSIPLGYDESITDEDLEQAIKLLQDVKNEQLFNSYMDEYRIEIEKQQKDE